MSKSIREKREEYAAMAMQALVGREDIMEVASTQCGEDETVGDFVANQAVIVADALIRRLEKGD